MLDKSELRSFFAGEDPGKGGACIREMQEMQGMGPLRAFNVRPGDGDTHPGQGHQRDTGQQMSQDMMLGA